MTLYKVDEPDTWDGVGALERAIVLGGEVTALTFSPAPPYPATVPGCTGVSAVSSDAPGGRCSPSTRPPDLSSMSLKSVTG